MRCPSRGFAHVPLQGFYVGCTTFRKKAAWAVVFLSLLFSSPCMGIFFFVGESAGRGHSWHSKVPHQLPTYCSCCTESSPRLGASMSYFLVVVYMWCASLLWAIPPWKKISAHPRERNSGAGVLFRLAKVHSCKCALVISSHFSHWCGCGTGTSCNAVHSSGKLVGILLLLTLFSCKEIPVVSGRAQLLPLILRLQGVSMKPHLLNDVSTVCVAPFRRSTADRECMPLAASLMDAMALHQTSWV